MNYVEKEWISFKNQVISNNAPDIQVREMKKAFYAGAGSIFYKAIELAGDAASDNPITEEDVRPLDDIHNELQAFKNELLLGLPTTNTDASVN